MDINEFKSKLGAGGARPNQFRIDLNYPTLLGVVSSSESLLVSAAALPASNVNPAIVMYRGREVKLAGERTFDPWSITIINDTTMKLRDHFEQWSNLMNDRFNNGGVIVPNDYMADLLVHQLDRNDETIRSYIMRGAFPLTVSEVGLRYDLNDIISEFTVTLAYQTFDIAGPKSPF